MAVAGIRARGGFDVAMQWKDDKLASATIGSAAPTKITVRYGSKTAEVSIGAGQTLRLDADLAAVD